MAFLHAQHVKTVALEHGLEVEQACLVGYFARRREHRQTGPWQGLDDHVWITAFSDLSEQLLECLLACQLVVVVELTKLDLIVIVRRVDVVVG